MTDQETGLSPWRKWLREWIAPAVIVGVLAIIVSIVIAAREPGTKPTSPTSPTAHAPSVAPTDAPSTSECVNENGSPLTCAERSAWVVVNASTCTQEQVSRVLGAQERQLDLTTTKAGQKCLARPGSIADTAGATAVDLLQLKKGQSISTLTLCLQASDSIAPDIACSSTHWGEIVSAIGPFNGRTPVDELCRQRARTYTLRPVGDGLEPLLTAMITPSRDTYRCLVHLDGGMQLTNSVWRIGGNALPTNG